MSNRFLFLTVAGLAWMAYLSPVHAQDRPARHADEIFREEVREVVRRTDKSVAMRTQRRGNRRVDEETGVVRATYAIEARAAAAATPIDAARHYLSEVRREFGLDGAGELEVVSVRATGYSHHVLFQQHVDGIPVYRRFVKVNLDRDLRPTLTLNGVAPGLAGAAMPRASISAAAATQVVREAVTKGDVNTSEPELLIYPSEPPVPVWRMLAWPTDVSGEWEVLVEATTGKVMQILDRASHRVSGRFFSDTYHRPHLDALSDGVSNEIVAMVDGSGLAFDPDPLTTSGSAYVPPYTDNADAPTPELEAERILVTLRDIPQGSDGLYRLDGPFVRIVGGGPLSFEPPRESSPDGFRYSRSEPGFEAVGAYYHLDKSQRYVQSLGFFDLQNAPIRVNPRASAVDNSFYTPGQNFLEFGTGGVDDAEDAGVMLHEYAHALLEAGQPGLSVDGEGQALHEGWADYWAGSYMRFLADSQTGKRTDWENVFRWDSGDGQIWPGRSLTKVGVYPDDTTCDDPGDPNGDGCAIHSDGLIFATALMDIYSEVGKNVMDRLTLQSHAYLASPVTFVDAAEALVQADQDLHGGVHTSVIISRLSERGYLDASSFGPVVSHQPLRSTEQLGATVDVQVQAVASTSPVESVVVSHRVKGESDFNTFTLTSSGDDNYAGELDLPVLPSTIEYFVEAIDRNSIQSRLPSNAPASLFEFDVGPDQEEPEISHIPISSASSALWPVPVIATVEDNLGVDSVWVDYGIEDADGVVYLSGSFGLRLIGSQYRAAFPVDVAEFRVGSTVRYSITARDAAVAGNTAAAPASGTYGFSVVFSGVLASFDFEQSGGDLVGTGAWAHGRPVATLRVAHSGLQAWGTVPDGPYPAFGQLSSLSLPEFNLSGLSKVYLVFWHWYDFEYRGEAFPGAPLVGKLWDGGNVKVSTDGGATWNVLEPEGGYIGRIEPTSTNPLGGELAFGGYSFGWRREILELPAEDGLQVRFDFGSDESNLEESVGFAGWFVDDIALVTERPIDQSPPAVVNLPPSLTLQNVDLPLPDLEVTVDEDTGVASAFADYVILGSQPSVGSLPLAMALDDLDRFTGKLPVDSLLKAGDRFEYRLRIKDFDGNETLAPPSGVDRLAIEFRTVRGKSVMNGVVATGQWTRAAGEWSTRPAESFSAVSSLVLSPTTLAADSADVWLQLRHSHDMGVGVGGNVSFSVDDGRTWSVLEPVGGYPGRLSAGGHPMDGLDIFTGSSGGAITTLFDLTPYAGRLLHVRFDFGASRAWEAAERWTITDASVFASSVQEAIEVPDKLALSSNFPDPFSDRTTIRYTLPRIMPVRIDVYNMLGQLVALLLNGTQDKGTHTITFDGSRLPSGVYVVVMKAGLERKTEMMIIAR